MDNGEQLHLDMDLPGPSVVRPSWPFIGEKINLAVENGTLDEELQTIESQLPENYHKRIHGIGHVALKYSELENAKKGLDLAVHLARQAGASWSDIGRAVRVDPVAATRRWDPVARKKHREYQSRQPKPKKTKKDH